MDRRTFCLSVVGGSLGALSGCNAPMRSVDGMSTTTSTRSGSADETPSQTTVPLAQLGQPADICEADVKEDFSIKAIDEPAFATDWAGYVVDPKYLRTEESTTLSDEAVVIGRVSAGQARAYPLTVLWHHEVVNDTLGVPLIVTYCSFCRTGVVADRRIRGETAEFGVSGQLWIPPDRYISASAKAGRSFAADRWNVSDTGSVRDAPNLVMYDKLTGSFWSQAIGQAICGPLTGTRLSMVPSTLMNWSDWKADHPETEVLLPPPHSSIDE